MRASRSGPAEGPAKVSYPDVRERFTTGDLLCFRSKDLDGTLVRVLTRSDYSHVGLVYVFEGRVYCLEAVTAGVRLVLMSRRARDYHGGIDYFRIPAATEEQRRGALSFAFEQLGSRYNMPGIGLFLWFLLSGNKEKVRARHGWFCSEIVAEAYRRQGLQLAQHSAARYTSPGALAASDRVELAFRLREG
jgi:uncharacterized protein YycO